MWSNPIVATAHLSGSFSTTGIAFYNLPCDNSYKWSNGGVNSMNYTINPAISVFEVINPSDRDRFVLAKINAETGKKYTTFEEYLNSLEPIEPDEWDLAMLAECADDDRDDFISLDELVKQLGLKRDELPH